MVKKIQNYKERQQTQKNIDKFQKLNNKNYLISLIIIKPRKLLRKIFKNKNKKYQKLKMNKN